MWIWSSKEGGILRFQVNVCQHMYRNNNDTVNISINKHKLKQRNSLQNIWGYMYVLFKTGCCVCNWSRLAWCLCLHPGNSGNSGQTWPNMMHYDAMLIGEWRHILSRKKHYKTIEHCTTKHLEQHQARFFVIFSFGVHQKSRCGAIFLSLALLQSASLVLLLFNSNLESEIVTKEEPRKRKRS